MGRQHQQPTEPPEPRRSLLGHLTALLLKTVALSALAVIVGIILTRTTTFDISSLKWWWIPAGALAVAILWQTGALATGNDQSGQTRTQTTDIYGRTTEAFYDQSGQRRDITYRPGAGGYNTIEQEKENNSGWY